MVFNFLLGVTKAIRYNHHFQHVRSRRLHFGAEEVVEVDDLLSNSKSSWTQGFEFDPVSEYFRFCKLKINFVI